MAAWYDGIARGASDGSAWVRDPNLRPEDGVAWAVDRALWLGSGGAVLELGVVPAADVLETFGESAVDVASGVASGVGEVAGAGVGGAASGLGSRLSLGGLAVLAAAAAGAFYVLRR